MSPFAPLSSSIRNLPRLSSPLDPRSESLEPRVTSQPAAGELRLDCRLGLEPSYICPASAALHSMTHIDFIVARGTLCVSTQPGPPQAQRSECFAASMVAHHPSTPRFRSPSILGPAHPDPNQNLDQTASSACSASLSGSGSPWGSSMPVSCSWSMGKRIVKVVPRPGLLSTLI